MKRSMFFRNFVMLVSILIIPLIICNIWFISYSNKAIDRVKSYMARRNVERMQEVFDSIVEEVRQSLVNISLSNDIENFLYGVYDYPHIDNIQKDIQNYLYINKYIHSIYVINPKDGLVVNQNYLNPIAFNEEDSTIFNIASALETNRIEFYPYAFRDNYPHLLALIYRVAESQADAFVVANINLDEVKTVFSGSVTGEESMYILLGDTIIYSANMEQYFLKDVSEIPQISEILRASGEARSYSRSNTAYTLSENFDFKYIVNLLGDSGKSLYSDFVQSLLVIIVVTTLLGLTVAFLFTKYSVDPIKNIMYIIENDRVENDKTLSNNLPTELKTIVDSIMETKNSNKCLTKELGSRIHMLKQMQVAALYSQINSHFINNTLDYINWMVYCEVGDNVNISRSISDFSALFRLNLRVDSFVHTLGEELLHTQKYCDIIEMRFGDMVSIEFNVPDTLTDILVPIFLLQPLIENSVYHGIKPKNTVGKILIEAFSDDATLIIKVKDDGMGMSEQKRQEINQNFNDNYKYTNSYFVRLLDESSLMPEDHISNTKKGGVGIANINNRIKLIFGEKYGVQFDNAQSITCAVITLPLIRNF